ncbi:MAG: ATP-binding protein [Planctomycetaceae bacterium]
MTTNVLLCDTPDEVARLQYELLREAPDLLVESTTDAFKAVESAARSRPDVVVCDLALDGIGGAEFVRRLRASTPATHVIARASHPEPDDIRSCLASGASAFLLKADRGATVVAAIRAVALGSVVLSPTAASVFGDEVARTAARLSELESELTEVRDEVSKGTSAKADFLANISHELRTPVTVAKGIAYVLRNPSVPESERDQFLEQLQASLDRLMAIVDELITVAELERGTFSLELGLTDLGPLVRHAVDEVGRQYPSVPVVAQVPDALMAIADGARIGGVVRELLDNACRYSPPGRTVELVARNLDEGVVITVTDRGEGIDRAVAMRAFEQPCSTGEGTLRKEKAGVGVGLHLARQVVVEHGGIVWSDPLPGGGSRVSFCIPSHEGAHLDAPPAGAA